MFNLVLILLLSALIVIVHALLHCQGHANKVALEIHVISIKNCLRQHPRLAFNNLLNHVCGRNGLVSLRVYACALSHLRACG